MSARQGVGYAPQTMQTWLAIGATYAFAAAVQPGPFQTYLISRTLRSGLRSTIPAVLAPVASDGPIIFLVLVVLRTFPPAFAPLMQCAGGTFLLWLAYSAGRAWKNYQAPEALAAAPPGARRALGDAVVVNLLNPNPWLTWSLVLGPLLLKAWRETPSHGIALLAGFYVTLTATTAAIVSLLAAAKTIGPRVTRFLLGLSAIALGAFAVWQLVSGLRALL